MNLPTRRDLRGMTPRARADLAVTLAASLPATSPYATYTFWLRWIARQLQDAPPAPTKPQRRRPPQRAAQLPLFTEEKPA